MEPDSFFPSKRPIIIVAPKAYKGLGRRLAHAISKRPEYNVAVWTVKQYEDNEYQQSVSRYVLLLGNAGENPMTKDYLDEIKTLQNRAGACYGFDGTKAVVFGEGRLEQTEAFKKLVLSLKFMLPIAIWFILSVIVPIATIWSVSVIAKKAKLFRIEQTKAAIALFMIECFDEWAGITKTEKNG